MPLLCAWPRFPNGSGAETSWHTGTGVPPPGHYEKRRDAGCSSPRTSLRAVYDRLCRSAPFTPFGSTLRPLPAVYRRDRPGSLRSNESSRRLAAVVAYIPLRLIGLPLSCIPRAWRA